MSFERFIPGNLDEGASYRVKQTFYASGVPVHTGTVVRVDWVRDHAEDRIYRLDIALTPIDPPGGTIIWGRTHPLEQRYVDETFEKVS